MTKQYRRYCPSPLYPAVLATTWPGKHDMMNFVPYIPFIYHGYIKDRLSNTITETHSKLKGTNNFGILYKTNTRCEISIRM